MRAVRALTSTILVAAGCSIAHAPPVQPLAPESPLVHAGAPSGVDALVTASDAAGDWEAHVLVDGAESTVLRPGTQEAHVTIPFGSHEIGLELALFQNVTTYVSQTTYTTQTTTTPCGPNGQTCTNTTQVPSTHMVPVVNRVKKGGCTARAPFAAVFEEPRAIAVIAREADCAIKDATPRLDPFARR